MSQEPNSSDLNRWCPDRPYNTLPHLPPAIELETKAVLRQCITARAALAGLRHAVELIPNPSMLINTLPILEAQASTEIENIVTTADALFRHLHGEGPTDAATWKALQYREALLNAFASMKTRPLSTRTAESICTSIRGVEMRVRRVPGTALANVATGEVISLT